MRFGPASSVLAGLAVLFVWAASGDAASARTVDLRNLPLDVQRSMLQVCNVEDGKVQAQNLECLDYHARAWRKLVFKPDLDRLSLRRARLLREACTARAALGPAPWARCIEAQMVEQGVEVVYPDLSRLTQPLRNRARQMCENAARVSGHREAACLAKVRDRLLAGPQPPSADPVIQRTNTRRGQNPEAERIDRGGRQVAALTPGVLDFRSLDPSDPFWPSWRGVRPARPEPSTGETLTPDGLYGLVAPSVYVVLSAADADAFRAGRNVRQGSGVAISDATLATNCHILKDAGVIVLLQGERTGRARLVRAHPATDRCLLESDDMVLRPVAGVRPFDDLKMGETVYSVSAPHGLQQTLHDGIVSQLRSNDGISLIQTSAHAAPGSSGGGLFDRRGNLVGITNFTVARDTRLHFAIAAGAFWE